MRKLLHFSEKKVIQFLFIFCAITVFILALVGDKGYLQLLTLKSQEKALKLEIEHLEGEKRIWINKIQSIKTNSSYLETYAREQLGMIGKNEVLILFKPKDDPEITETP